ncbi:Sir2 family protein [Chryseobacterium wanjuense]|uniref:Sir2 family protein n=2 Tax=Chryseobacterium wanjuense TaxID=356305 RepID=A0A1I0N4F2_9FLAO|nr:Sir2 family protein [Chryseobacterium wanjuense]
MFRGFFVVEKFISFKLYKAMKEQLEEIIHQIYHKEKRNLFTFLTGAGISSDSGIPTYRGIDGIWVKGTQFHKPEEIDEGFEIDYRNY